MNRRQMEITKKNPPFALATIELKRTLFIVSIRPNFLSRKKKKIILQIQKISTRIEPTKEMKGVKKKRKVTG